MKQEPENTRVSRFGKPMTTLGAAMLAISIGLAMGGVTGATFHNVMQTGGLALLVVGWVLWRIVKV